MLQKVLKSCKRISALDTDCEIIEECGYFLYNTITQCPQINTKLTQFEDIDKIICDLRALHGEVSIYIWFLVTPCVYIIAR